MRLFFAAATLAALAGCSTVSSITPANSIELRASSPSSSERTFRAMLPVLRDCYPVKFAIDSNYFPDAKEGEITLAVQNDSARLEMAKMTITQQGAGSIVTMRRPTSYDGFDKALPEWVKGNDGGCPLGTRPDPQPSGSAKNANNYPVR
jgi:hypothetical protein